MKCDYEMRIVNQTDIVNCIQGKYPFLQCINVGYIKDMVQTIFDIAEVSFTKKIETPATNFEMFEDQTVKTQNQDNNIDILQFITEESLNTFQKHIQNALFDRINRNRDKNHSILFEDLLTTYRYRASFIEYGMKYKDICNNSSYETSDKLLLTKFFINGIYSNDAWHQDRNGERILILRATNANSNSLLDYDTYTNDILYPIITKTLLCDKIEVCTLSNTDLQKLNKYLYDRIHNKESD